MDTDTHMQASWFDSEGEGKQMPAFEAREKGEEDRKVEERKSDPKEKAENSTQKQRLM